MIGLHHFACRTPDVTPRHQGAVRNRESLALMSLLVAACLCAQTPSTPQPRERVASPEFNTVASTLQVYASPKNNQSQEQQLKDETECYKWARGQSALPEEQDVRNAANGGPSKTPIPATENVRRAYSVCMQSHNYTIQ